MKRKIKFSSLLLLMAILIACGPKEPPNVSPEAHSQFIASKYTKALNEFQLVVEAAYKNGNLSRENTRYIAQAVRVALDTIHETPNVARATALNALTSINNQIANTGELTKFLPYISATRSVIEGIKE